MSLRIPRLCQSSVFFVLSAALLLALPGRTLALNGCPDRFAQFASALQTLNREIPALGNARTYKQRIETRRTLWNKKHPDNLNNFPTPEHQGIMAEIKSMIDRLPASRRENWLPGWTELHDRGNPYTDVALFVEKFVNYHSTKKPALNMETRMTSMALYAELKDTYLRGLDKDKAENLIRKITEIEYEDAKKPIHELEQLILSRAKAGSSENAFSDLVARLRAARKEDALRTRDNDLYSYTDTIRETMARDAVIIGTSNISVRGLVDAVMLDIKAVQFSRTGVSADFQFLAPRNLYGHDFGHASMDPWSIYGKPSMEIRLKVLDALDKISDPTLRAATEKLLFEFLHENPNLPLEYNRIDVARMAINSEKDLATRDQAAWAVHWLHENLWRHMKILGYSKP